MSPSRTEKGTPVVLLGIILGLLGFSVWVLGWGLVLFLLGTGAVIAAFAGLAWVCGYIIERFEKKMSLKETILNGMVGYTVYNLDVDREHVEKGQPATRIKLYTASYGDPEFTFAKANGMSGEDMVKVMRSYLRSDNL